ncbi:MAG: SPOR domain-containing protein [Treponemataceae bacterium]
MKQPFSKKILLLMVTMLFSCSIFFSDDVYNPLLQKEIHKNEESQTPASLFFIRNRKKTSESKKNSGVAQTYDVPDPNLDPAKVISAAKELEGDEKLPKKDDVLETLETPSTQLESETETAIDFADEKRVEEILKNLALTIPKEDLTPEAASQDTLLEYFTDIANNRWLQVGAFRNARNALNAVLELKNHNFDVKVARKIGLTKAGVEAQLFAVIIRDNNDTAMKDLKSTGLYVKYKDSFHPRFN